MERKIRVGTEYTGRTGCQYPYHLHCAPRDGEDAALVSPDGTIKARSMYRGERATCTATALTQ